MLLSLTVSRWCSRMNSLAVLALQGSPALKSDGLCLGCQWPGCNYHTGKTGTHCILHLPVWCCRRGSTCGGAGNEGLGGQEWDRVHSVGSKCPGSGNKWILHAAGLTSLFFLPGRLFFQLLNQFENTGPPPADKEKIQALPTIQITQEHVGMYLLHGVLHRVLPGSSV